MIVSNPIYLIEISMYQYMVLTIFYYIYLFLIYINYLNQAIKFCKVHHFADGTNLFCVSNSIKKFNKLVNADLKRLVNWLNANKVSLNVKQLRW